MSIKKLEKLCLVLENCEVIEFDGQHIGEFEIAMLEREYTRRAINSFAMLEIAHLVQIGIHKDADTQYRPFDTCDARYKFERLLSCPDITQIEFTLCCKDEEGKTQRETISILPCWTGDMSEENESQKCYLSAKGNLHIFISDRKSFEECYDTDRLDMGGLYFR